MIFFISDLHLCPSRPAIAEAFFAFLKGQAKAADALYILGDFFDAWVGDDDDTPLYRDIEQALKDYQQQGTQTFFMHGNRDFLVGEAFATRTHITLLSDPTLITLAGIPTLLMHGDSLCTRDTDYIHFRNIVRHASWQQELLAKPLAERKAIAQQLRTASQSMNSLKAEDIMDVTPSEVDNIVAHHHASRLIHGHTHRPQRHPIHQNKERIVLGDWHDNGWYLCSQGTSLTLNTFPI